MRRLIFTTIHPEFIRAYCQFGVFKSAIQNKLVDIQVLNLRDFAIDGRGTVDDHPFGGGEGMVLRPEPLERAVMAVAPARVILVSPQGRILNQAMSNELQASGEDLHFICGRFGGVDQRFIDRYVDEEISVGDFVVSGGELPALTIADSLLRHIPGVLGRHESALCDSFSSGMEGCLEYPLYTRPQQFQGASVPDVLLSGHHERILAWRQQQSRERTRQRRPDLMR